jgi:hypothetical protein
MDFVFWGKEEGRTHELAMAWIGNNHKDASSLN